MSESATPAKEIDAYIAGFPPEVRKILEQVRRLIGKTAPEATEAMKYGIPTLILDENLVHFAGYKTHIGLYPGPSGIAAFETELAPYKKAKGSVQFPLGQPIPFDLIERIVAFRVAEVEEKFAGRRKGR